MNMLEAMEMFVAVVDHGSYTKAAESMRLHRPALSKTIQNLEKDLGVQLLHRTTRRVNVTPDGELFYDRSVQLLTDISDVLEWFSPNRPPKGKLRVDMPTVVANAIIIPKLPDFLERYPGLELFIGTSDHQNDLIASGIDCAIRLGVLDDSSMIAKPIGQVELVNCAAPKYIAQRGSPATIEDLRNHVAVNFIVGHRRQIMPWRFRVDGELVDIKMKSAVAVDNAGSFLHCGLAGIGVLQGLRPAVQEHIDSGALVEVLKNLHTEPKQVSILFPDRRNLSPNVRVFVEWVAELFRSLNTQKK
ncbi:LysR family transcriptional regulator [Pseudomonas iranensis]|uniref:LysR family transcriptional regulator n=1 Tax=Pseudomonas iranensis TaxID=2745503 RepID=UPI00164665D0|nr:LysR family transcriptional regulator [Pseudomonas iranensis]QXI20151.1 LysR family transcriptional regulator [Pseudomonas iranensis]